MSAFTAATNLSSPALALYVGPQPKTERGAGVPIGKHPKLPKIIYPAGKYIVVRDLENPSDCFVYRGHNALTSVAKFSPNGFWVASADCSGKVRVWSWDNPEHILRLETTVFNGEVKDLDWDPESKRIVAVGEGQEKNAKVFMWDTANSLGELTGHGKRVISVSYRPCRPFRLITASEDNRTVFYSGPPFVLDHSNTEHSNWVNCVRYSPDGNSIVTVSSDKKIVIYDGKTGQFVADIVDAHGGSIYSVAFSPDGKKFITCSADKTVKLWDLAAKSCEAVFSFDDSQVGNMQVGVAWVGSHLISLSLCGDLTFLNPSNPSQPLRVLQGLQVTVTALDSPPGCGVFYTGSYDGVVTAWDRAGIATRLRGALPKTTNFAVHSGKITGVLVSGGNLKTVGFDDKLRIANLDSQAYEGVEIPLPGQPVSIANGGHSSDLAVVIYQPKGVAAFRGTTKVADTALPFTPTAISVLGEVEVAIGGDDGKIYVYELAGDTFLLRHTVTGPRGMVSALVYSPSGDYLGVGDSNREVSVFERGSWTAKIQGSWVHHVSRITSLAWSPSGELLASGSTDTHVMVWNLAKPNQRIAFEVAHKDGVSNVGWLSATELVSTGGDACIAVWDLSKATSK